MTVKPLVLVLVSCDGDAPNGNPLLVSGDQALHFLGLAGFETTLTAREAPAGIDTAQWGDFTAAVQNRYAWFVAPESGPDGVESSALGLADVEASAASMLIYYSGTLDPLDVTGTGQMYARFTYMYEDLSQPGPDGDYLSPTQIYGQYSSQSAPYTDGLTLEVQAKDADADGVYGDFDFRIVNHGSGPEQIFMASYESLQGFEISSGEVGSFDIPIVASYLGEDIDVAALLEIFRHAAVYYGTFATVALDGRFEASESFEHEVFAYGLISLD